LKLSGGKGIVRLRMELDDRRRIKNACPEAFKFKPMMLECNFKKFTQTLMSVLRNQWILPAGGAPWFENYTQLSHGFH
jgi:hypothetical protein